MPVHIKVNECRGSGPCTAVVQNRHAVAASAEPPTTLVAGLKHKPRKTSTRCQAPLPNRQYLYLLRVHSPTRTQVGHPAALNHALTTLRGDARRAHGTSSYTLARGQLIPPTPLTLAPGGSLAGEVDFTQVPPAAGRWFPRYHTLPARYGS